jgi:hypothetical protein
MSRNVVIIKGGEGQFYEAIAGAEIYPGELVEFYSDSGTLKVRPHSNAGQSAGKFFANLNTMEGETLSDAYAAGERVELYCPLPGEVIQGRVSNGQDVSQADELESAGDGRLQSHSPDTWASANAGTIYPQTIIGTARAAVSMSGSSGEDDDGFVEIVIW